MSRVGGLQVSRHDPAPGRDPGRADHGDIRVVAPDAVQGGRADAGELVLTDHAARDDHPDAARAEEAGEQLAAGILERRQYSGHPARSEYHLTEAGRDLYPVIATLMRWGDKYLAGDDGPPLVLEHTCGHQLVAQLTCQACGEPLESGQARIVRQAS